MASLLFSLLRRPSPRLSLSVAVLSRLSPLPSCPLPTFHLFSTSSPLPSLALNPDQIWLELPSPPPNLKISKSQWDDLTALFRSFSKSPGAIHQALSLYLPSYAFPAAVGKFRVIFLSNCSTLTAENLLEMAEFESESAVHRFLFPNFAVFCMTELQADLKIFKKLMETADLTKPHTWYPFARAMKRKDNEEVSDKVLEVEHIYNETPRPVYIKLNDVIKLVTIPDFWLTAYVNRALLDDLLNEEDQKNFSENPYIDNKTLTKTFSSTDEGTTTVKATPFNWKEGMNIANGSTKHEKKGKKRPLFVPSLFMCPSEAPWEDMDYSIQDEEADEELEGEEGEEGFEGEDGDKEFIPH